ncbi:hypothetical protein BH20VER3_BH20VER3_19420 [soil metagenome]
MRSNGRAFKAREPKSKSLLSAFSAVTDAQQRPGFQNTYPPDLQEEATKTVLAQAELLCADWAEVADV